MILLNFPRVTWRPPIRVLLASATGLLLAGCATTSPEAFRRYFVPPPAPEPQVKSTEPLNPPPQIAYYANEVPALPVASATVPRNTDTDLLLRRADEYFANGKRATLEGRPDDARREFNRSIDLLLNAPENLPDRAKLEGRLEEIADSIYRYDQGQLGSGVSDDELSYDKRPLDEILEMTFPLDPSLRGKIREQIQATASELPLEESDAVDSYINFFSTPKGRRILVAGLQRSGRYKAMISRILMEEGVPQELIFLAQAESGFLPRALGPLAKGCGAGGHCAGMWQFASWRGKEYGLDQGPAIDDRFDPEKATRAAARHLRDLYTHFGDWYLAMAAYNCGPGCIDNAVMKTGYADFWELRRRNALPLATANYVPAILAMTIMSKNAEAYGLTNLDMEPSLAYDSLELQTPTHIALVAAAVDRSVSEIKELNPGLLKSVAPQGYTLRLPAGTLPMLEAALKVIPEDRRDTWRVHRVESGDTLETVAKRYGTTLALVSAANHDSLPDAGALAAIPVAYPGDPAAKPKVVAKGAPRKVASSATGKPGHSKSASSSKPSGKAKVASAKSKSKRAAGA